MCCVCWTVDKRAFNGMENTKDSYVLGNKFTSIFSSALLFMIQMAWPFEHSEKKKRGRVGAVAERSSHI